MTTPVSVFGEHDEKTIVQLMDVASRAERAALMADGHLGYIMPIGGVAAYKDKVSVAGVGFDIACVDRESEYLSPTGWRRICDYLAGEQIMQYDPRSGTGSWVTPRFVNVACPAFLTLETRQGIDQWLSPEHRVLVWKYGSYSRRDAEPTVMPAKEFAAEHNRLKLGFWADFETACVLQANRRVPFTDAEIRVAVMVSADGSLRRRVHGGAAATLSVKKRRKAERARELLRSAGIAYSEHGDRRGYTTFRFDPPVQTKSLGVFWGASREQLTVLADEAVRWDGSVDPLRFYSRDREAADLVQYAFTVTGRRAYLKTDARADGAVDYRVFAYDKSMVGMRASPKTPIETVPSADGRAYCFTTETGFWVMRRNGKVVMTGNCGNCAIRTDRGVEDTLAYDRDGIDLRALAGEIEATLSFGVGRKNAADDAPVNDPLFDSDAWEGIPKHHRAALKAKAREQLGTIGSGNHYVDVFADERDALWIGVHFGSRGLGYNIAKGVMNLARGEEWNAKGAAEEETLLDLTNAFDLGQAYWEMMTLAGRYAYVGREWVARKVAAMLGASEVEMVHNHHNYAWREAHDDEEFVVVRKGATPAFPGQRGFVGGSMGDDAVILRGSSVRTSAARNALFSTVHGAGRIMSRTQAAGKWDWKRKVRKSAGAIDATMMASWLLDKGVILRGGGLDEAPQVYRRLNDVLDAQGDTIVIEHTLRPLVVVMAGEHEFDPFKD